MPSRRRGKNYDPSRDGYEIALALGARRRGIPVLAICRGLQVSNIAFGAHSSSTSRPPSTTSRCAAPTSSSRHGTRSSSPRTVASPRSTAPDSGP
ncbi:gamma-glutamyl-gamma-aminobutyrate hydrolase family protein [Microbacterium oxydans]|nr:gamma-glutamyl-gamma-aminobutyrate hydrolase family protein [Microbacterium oxydans]